MQEATQPKTSIGACPIDHSYFSHQKTAQHLQSQGPAIECDENGTWHIRNFDAARAILRSATTKQAGFNAELLNQMPSKMKQPILYQEGKDHQLQRKQTAKFFTPKAVSQNYRQMMEELTDQLMLKLQQKKSYDLSQLSLEMAVRVAAEVIGLTHSSVPGMAQRLEAFFNMPLPKAGSNFRDMVRGMLNQRHLLAFFYLDVKPSIKDHRKNPRQDVISHLIEQNYKDMEILTECVTYGAAGMITTREFISVATWHFLEKPELRARYLVAPEEERYEILHEILRLEPVVGNLYRRAIADIAIEHNGIQETIPAGALINIDIHNTNTDESIVGEYPMAVNPGRSLSGNQVPSMMVSFGDGAHRCPGAYVAIQESDIFLQKLLALDGLRVAQKPSVQWNELVTGYEIRNFTLSVN